MPRRLLDTLPGAYGSVPPQTGTPTNGGVVTIAESPGAGPTYIFPIYPAADASMGTNQQFQQYMWRSLVVVAQGRVTGHRLQPEHRRASRLQPTATRR